MKQELFKPPYTITKEHKQKELTIHLIARILRLMKAFNMQSQKSISSRQVADAADRLIARIR